MLKGRQTWEFENRPVILSSAATAGPFEANGPLADDFDILFEDMWLGEDSFEKAQKVLIEEAAKTAIEKAGIQNDDIQFVFAGDLLNQMTSTSFACRSLCIPYFGLFGACSTSMEGLALAAFVINHSGANYVLTGSTSHNAAIEKQFRYPTEYGAQKPPTAQWTATAAGVGVVAKVGSGPVVTSATIGKVVDMGLSDPFNMGEAMAPAAADTIEMHFQERGVGPDYYDLIATGDLGKIGLPIVKEMLEQKGYSFNDGQLNDCGLMIYRDGQPVLAGGSGSGCSASVTYGHLLNRMKKGEINRMLIVATGALLSPMSYQQNETIPCIAHAVSIEAGGALA
ncbi:stage V sporulation protein AD [Halalkalibacterium halodurans]|jgi:stage V sporulation protein AD|uniref:Stage V sporulation protein AD n=2 Tax=Halalkalibacterium halodurans TaxID=86665 RepID=Q9KCK2_HALH5|nr:stage V sporulation protein AD [Halalkalibacterium halodurans]MDY7222141.1 stage V sporulation protein AD [Halalkalibacterium halodurans]MDY7241362.1 stage V sporulation protein AD [Halalkalibacterium halodurans]MED3646793.1 stage V sporulation protein AD [Halalkalibacterium halodurans]MED4081858.1 stage V sporulation protein AD [Halalkalibacterium halodurans]MED4086405.1 stage V sporulation protein AD [Halalkalibacterium halodurans]